MSNRQTLFVLAIMGMAPAVVADPPAFAQADRAPVSPKVEKRWWVKDVGKEENTLRSDCLKLLLEDDFATLDDLAVQFSKNKERVGGGVWKLRHLSDGVSTPANTRDEAQWVEMLSALRRWSDSSKTAFAMNALGHGQLNYAWNASGVNESGGTKPENFGPSLKAAGKSLRAAVAMDPECIDVYRSLLHLGTSERWSREKMEETFRAAIKVGPEYFDNYYNMGFYLLPQWHGKPGEAQRFANTIPDLVPGDSGFEIYTRTTMQLISYTNAGKEFDADRPDRFHWAAMKKGFEIMMNRYGGLFTRNRFALYACVAQDEATGKKLIGELIADNELHYPAWGTLENLEATLKFFGIE